MKHTRKQRDKIGEYLRGFLKPVSTQAEVAAKLGISYQAVDKIEKRALYKIAMRLRAISSQIETDEFRRLLTDPEHLASLDTRIKIRICASLPSGGLSPAVFPTRATPKRGPVY